MGYLPSNGSEGRWFQEATCEVCIHDHGWHPVEIGPYKWRESDNVENAHKSCTIMMQALCGEAPEEWSIEDGKPRCSGFELDVVCSEIKQAYACGLRDYQRTTGTWVSPYPAPEELIQIHPDQMAFEL